MKTPFVNLLSCLHQAPCFHCDETHKCSAPVMRKLSEYSGYLADWAQQPHHADGSDLQFSAFAKDFEHELAHLRPDCPGLLSRPHA